MLQETTLVVGAVQVTVSRPESMRLAQVQVTFEPETQEGFEECAEAVGGLGALTLPKHAEAYTQHAIVWRDELLVAIAEPPRAREHGRVEHPFFGPIAQRLEEEAATAEATAAAGEGFLVDPDGPSSVDREAL